MFAFHTAIADFFQCLYKSDQRSMRCNKSVENKSRIKRSLENGCCWFQSDQLPISTWYSYFLFGWSVFRTVFQYSICFFCSCLSIIQVLSHQSFYLKYWPLRQTFQITKWTLMPSYSMVFFRLYSASELYKWIM